MSDNSDNKEKPRSAHSHGEPEHGHECVCSKSGGLSRRSFLGSVGAGAVIAATARSGQAGESEQAPASPEEMVKAEFHINGKVYKLLVEPRWSLLFVLREKLGLTGAKEGCERGECGACTVLINDIPRYACMTLALEAEGEKITTIEGLLNGEDLGETQQAFVETDALQCGYCTPGQIMAVEGLLRKNPDPTLEEIRRGVSGNLCRCGAYHNIFKAGKRAAELKRGKGGS